MRRIAAHYYYVVPDQIETLCVLKKSVCGFHLLVPAPAYVVSFIVIAVCKYKIRVKQLAVD